MRYYLLCPSSSVLVHPLRHKKSGWQYLGNEESYRISAGVKVTGLLRAFKISKRNTFRFQDFWISLKLLTVLLITWLPYFPKTFGFPNKLYAWVTQPERPKGCKLGVGARRAPRLLACNICYGTLTQSSIFAVTVLWLCTLLCKFG